MEKINLEMKIDLERIKKTKEFIAPKVESPTSPGIKNLGELSDELKAKYTLIELYISEINKEKARCHGGLKSWRLEELKEKLSRAVDAFSLVFREKYGDDETIFHYSDWHVYKVPTEYYQTI